MTWMLLKAAELIAWSLQLSGCLQHRYSLSSSKVAVPLSRLLEMNMGKSVTSRGRLEEVS